MKYLIVGLLLLASFAGHSPPKPLEPPPASAWVQFRTSSPGIEGKVEVDFHESSGTVRMGLSIHQYRRSCAGALCRDVPVISGYTYQDVSRVDVLFDRLLSTASMHVMIPLPDSVTNSDLPVRLDVVWTATGPTRCDVLRGTMECQRTATVIGDVSVGRLRLVSAQIVPDGWIRWRLWNLPTYNNVP